MNLHIGWVDSGKYKARCLGAFYPRKEQTESCGHLGQNLIGNPVFSFGKWQPRSQTSVWQYSVLQLIRTPPQRAWRRYCFELLSASNGHKKWFRRRETETRQLAEEQPPLASMASIFSASLMEGKWYFTSGVGNSHHSEENLTWMISSGLRVYFLFCKTMTLRPEMVL